MKAERCYPAYTVTPKAEAAILKGHPWVYADEIAAAPAPPPENGAVVDVVSRKGRYLGSGLLSEASKIRVRLLSRNANDRFDEDFWRRRIQYAWAYRKAVYPAEDLQCCRVMFGEADGLPGLTVDKFGDCLSFQIVSLGMERMRDDILAILAEVFRPQCIYERDDLAVREKEGMEQRKGCVYGAVPPELIIREHDALMAVDIENGQKTGFFLDQKYNRQAVGRLCRGARVLDCFTHTGSFALNAGICGAEHVIGVDASELGVAQARENAALNGLEDRVEFLCADVFDLLPQLEQQGEQFDVVILDPPAFTKSRSSVKKAVKGYREINLRAMKLVRDGGFLATCSCSHFMDYELFTQTIGQAARNVHKRLRQVEYRTQSPDHPILWAADDSYYLKFYIFQVCDEK